MNFREDALAIVRETRKITQPHFGCAAVTDRKSKHPLDVVTELDTRVESFLKERLAMLEPAIGFVGEEFGGDEQQRFWLCDPIDGTANFVRGIPFSTTMLALIENNEVVASCIYDFVTDEMYWAQKGKGAFRDDVQISVSSRSLSDSLIVYGSKLAEQRDKDIMFALKDCASLVKMNAAGYEFIRVATGGYEAKINVNPQGKIYDYAPGSLLVSEAGGRVANIGSDSYDFRNRDLIAANPAVYAALTEGEDALFPVVYEQ